KNSTWHACPTIQSAIWCGGVAMGHWRRNCYRGVPPQLIRHDSDKSNRLAIFPCACCRPPRQDRRRLFTGPSLIFRIPVCHGPLPVARGWWTGSRLVRQEAFRIQCCQIPSGYLSGKGGVGTRSAGKHDLQSPVPTTYGLVLRSLFLPTG